MFFDLKTLVDVSDLLMLCRSALSAMIAILGFPSVSLRKIFRPNLVADNILPTQYVMPGAMRGAQSQSQKNCSVISILTLVLCGHSVYDAHAEARV